MQDNFNETHEENLFFDQLDNLGYLVDMITFGCDLSDNDFRKQLNVSSYKLIETVDVVQPKLKFVGSATPESLF